VEKTERVTMNMVILLNQACLEPLAAQQYRVNFGFDKVQLRIYDTDKLAADNLAACASYEPRSDDELQNEEATLTGYVSTDSELTESLKQLCTQVITRPERTVLQDKAEEAGKRPSHSVNQRLRIYKWSLLGFPPNLLLLVD